MPSRYSALAIDSILQLSSPFWRSRYAIWQFCKLIFYLVAVQLTASGTAEAEWKAANQQVSAAAKDAEIGAVLEAVNRIDRALIADDRPAFASFLAPDLVVNNPQNGISIPGATARRDAAGLITYSKYERSIEYAGKLGDMVMLMGDEKVIPKGNAPMAAKRSTGDSLIYGRWFRVAGL